MTQYWGGGGGGTRHFFLLTLYNFKNIGGGGGRCPTGPPYSAVPDVGTEFYLARHWTGDQPAVFLSPALYFQKIKRWRFTSSFNYSIFSF